MRLNLDNEHRYKHVSKLVETGHEGKLAILRNRPVKTVRIIPINRTSYSVIMKKGTCILINVATSGDGNVMKKEAKKILKYKDLTTDIQDTWNVKTKLILVIIEATGTIPNSSRKYMSKIRGSTKSRN